MSNQTAPTWKQRILGTREAWGTVGKRVKNPPPRSRYDVSVSGSVSAQLDSDLDVVLARLAALEATSGHRPEPSGA